MAHHNMFSAVLDLLQVRNFLKHALCGSAELLGIVIAPYQNLVAGKRTDNGWPFGFLCPDEIAEDIYRITIAYSAVPVFYDLVIHLIDVRKRPVLKPQNIFMPDMQIGDIKVCQSLTPFIIPDSCLTIYLTSANLNLAALYHTADVFSSLSITAAMPLLTNQPHLTIMPDIHQVMYIRQTTSARKDKDYGSEE